jgi:tyrosinase
MPPFIRLDVWTLAPNDPTITAYADAVAAMQAKTSSDPTSWAYQAAIHGTTVASPLPQFNQCRHGGWYFVSWHRAYLYYFERIVRAQVVANGGAGTWALPFWNYDGGGNHNTLPLAFRDQTRPDGSANPLFVPGRALTGNAGLRPAVTSPAFAMGRPTFTGASEFGGGQTSALGQFFTQTGRLEQTPHNDIHNMIGGIMLDPDTAALDPIFWLHHANIDRLWWLWQQSHANPADRAWRTASFSFVDVGGAAANATSAGVEDTLQQLGYTYYVPVIALVPPPTPPRRSQVKWPPPWPEGPAGPRPPEGPQPDPGPLRQIVGATSRPVRLVGNPVRVPVTIDQRAAAALRSALPAGERQQRAFLDIEHVDAERNPGTVYGVYVNLPESPTDDDLARHHVGNVSLFGIERARRPVGDQPAHDVRYSMEITSLLDQLAADKKWTDGRRVDVTFRPITLEIPQGAPRAAEPQVSAVHADTPITIGRVSIHYL